MEILKSVTICLPHKDKDFEEKFLDFLSQFGKRDKNSIAFQSSDKNYSPLIDLKIGDCELPVVTFNLPDVNEIKLVNKSGKLKKSPYDHSPISIQEFLSRAKLLNFEFLDHLGFDIPWFEGVHPEIESLRNSLSSQSLYYLYPSGENWDFIIPATKDEILSKKISYEAIRRPKFEIVSLNDSSKPIVQFDMSVKESFKEIRQLYPEGIPDNYQGNVWVYIKNPYGINICFVVGHRSKADWYKFLEKGLIK